MRIITFTAENVKKLRALEIRPGDARVVQVTGENGQGKTSVMDAIWWTLTGQKNIQDEPIRNGSRTAKSSLEIGGTAVEFVLTRTWRKNEKDETISSISVETAAGSTVRSPQSFLDGLIGSLALDPLEFARADAKKQYDIMRRFVTGYDFEMQAIERQKIFDDRALVNRLVDEAKTLVESIALTPDCPTERVDEDAILAKLTTIAHQNEEIGRKGRRRKEIAEECAAARLRCQNIITEIDDLEAKIAALRRESRELTEKADAGEKRLADAPPLPALLTTEDITAELTAAKETNRQVGLRAQRASYEDSLRSLKEESEALTAKIDAIDKSAKDAIEATKFPVPGLSLAKGSVIFNGVPFKQASDAEQLRVSIAIAMSANPKLRIIRVRDGSLLDSKAMKMLETMATDADYQVWIERVDESGSVGFVIEDGVLVSHVPADARPVTPPANKLFPSAVRSQPKPGPAVNPLTPKQNKHTFNDDVI